MNRTLVVLVSALVAVTSVAPADAGSRVSRTVVGSYGPYPAPVTGCNAPLGTFACLIVRVRPGETAFTARVIDKHGQPVFVEVHDDNTMLAAFCGRTARPVRMHPQSTLEFHIGMSRGGFASHECPLRHHVKTTGTIRVSLTRQR